MTNRLRLYINNLFSGAPDTSKTMELREEIFQNTLEKYNDLVSEGKSGQEAYTIAVEGIGNVSELIDELAGEEINMEYYENDRERAANFLAAGVVVYILSLVPVILGGVNGWNAGLCFLGFLCFVAVGTGLVIYGWQIKPKYTKADHTVVEEFREWSHKKKYSKKLRISISIALWAILITIYLGISVITWNWRVTWLVFPPGLAIEALISVYFSLKR